MRNVDLLIHRLRDSCAVSVFMLIDMDICNGWMIYFVAY